MSRFDRYALPEGETGAAGVARSRFDRYVRGVPGEGERMNPLLAAASGAADAFSFGFGDELQGFIGGDMARDRARMRQERARADQPLAFFGGQIAGGLAGGLGAGGVARAGLGATRFAQLAARSGPLSRIGYAGAAGGVGGALYGAGSAPEGMRGEGAANMIVPGIAGGVAGQAILGEALPFVAGRISRAVSPEAGAGRMLADTLGRHAPENVTPEAFEAGVVQRLRDAPANATVGDVVPGYTSMIQGAGARPSRARDELRTFYDNRNDQMGRVASDQAWDTLAPTAVNRSGFETMQARAAQRIAEARPLYRAVDARPVDGARLDRSLGEIIRRNPRIFSEGQRRADELMMSEHGTRFNQNDPRYWHYMLQGAQGTYETMRKAGRLGQVGGLDAREIGRYGAVLHNYNRTLRAALGPDFRRAQDIWSSQTRMGAAVERGYEAVTPGINSLELGTLRQDLNRMTPGEREHFMIGAVTRLSDMLKNADTGTGRADVLRAISRNEGQRELLDTLFGGSDGFQRLMRAVDQQRDLFDASVRSGIGVNSHTTPLALAAETQRALTQPRSLFEWATNALRREGADRFDERVSNEILGNARINANQAADEIGSVGGFERWAGGRGLLSRAVRERRRQLQQRPRALTGAIAGGLYYPTAGAATAQYGGGY